MIAIPITPQHKSPHHVLYGMIMPPTEKLVRATEIALDINCMMIKYLQVIVESPAAR